MMDTTSITSALNLNRDPHLDLTLEGGAPRRRIQSFAAPSRLFVESSATSAGAESKNPTFYPPFIHQKEGGSSSQPHNRDLNPIPASLRLCLEPSSPVPTRSARCPRGNAKSIQNPTVSPPEIAGASRAGSPRRRTQSLSASSFLCVFALHPGCTGRIRPESGHFPATFGTIITPAYARRLYRAFTGPLPILEGRASSSASDLPFGHSQRNHLMWRNQMRCANDTGLIPLRGINPRFSSAIRHIRFPAVSKLCLRSMPFRTPYHTGMQNHHTLATFFISSGPRPAPGPASRPNT